VRTRREPAGGLPSASPYNRRAMDPAAVPTPLPDLVLWRGDGCHCATHARELVAAILAERGCREPARAGGSSNGRIADDAAAHRAFLELIPVLEIDGAAAPPGPSRAGPIRAFLATRSTAAWSLAGGGWR